MLTCYPSWCFASKSEIVSALNSKAGSEVVGMHSNSLDFINAVNSLSGSTVLGMHASVVEIIAQVNLLP